MKKNMFNSFLFVVFGILFFASNVIRAYGTLAIVAEMPDQISEEIKGTGAHSGKGAGSAAHIRNIIHGDKNFPQKFFTIEAEKTPHITLAIIGTLNHNNTKVTDIAGKTFNVKDIDLVVGQAIQDYIKHQKRNQYEVPLYLKLDKGVKLLYEGKPRVVSGAKKVSVVQDVLGQPGIKASGKLAYLVGKLRKALSKQGVTFKYGFKPHVTLAAVSSSSLGIENLKKADNNPRSRLFRKFSDVASTTEKAHKKGSRYKSMKIDEILLSFDRNMKNTTAYRLR